MSSENEEPNEEPKKDEKKPSILDLIGAGSELFKGFDLAEERKSAWAKRPWEKDDDDLEEESEEKTEE